MVDKGIKLIYHKVMDFPPVPKESKVKIDQAGRVIAIDPQSIGADRNLVERWRACHAYPLNTFNSTLRVRVQKFSDSTIIAQRLKRMSTIIDKLARYPQMNLTRMQDIGGIRAILHSTKDVYQLATEYKKIGRFEHELVNEKDYIKNPRDEDGYRSLHLIYKYKNKRVPSYDGLLIELQIRTELQHTWATAVETMGTFLGQALKSRRGEKEWLDFFAIVSSAFAYLESSPRVPRFAGMSKIETFQQVAKANDDFDILNKIRGYFWAADWIGQGDYKRRGWFYHLITLDSLKRTIAIHAYKRDNFKQALKDYEKIEERVAKGEKIEPVLVSAGKVDQLRKAYPNFFLDIHDFLRKMEDIIRRSGKVVNL